MALPLSVAAKKMNRIAKKGPRLWDFLTAGDSETHGDD